jgi:hypothetical protein
MKTILLAGLWFFCGAAWLNPAMLTFVSGAPERVWLRAEYKGASVWNACVTDYTYDLSEGWLHVRDSAHPESEGSAILRFDGVYIQPHSTCN